MKAYIILLFVAATATATPTGAFWKGTFLDSTVEEMRSMCDADDALACIKYKAITFIDNVFNKDSFKLSDDVEVTRNTRSNEIPTGRSLEASSWTEKVEEYVRQHDVSINLPVVGTKVTLEARNLDADELDVKVHFGEGNGARSNGGVEARKSKLKKIFVPILVFVLLKAITLIPLALGVLGLKAWNALQLSFFSFVVSVSLAVFQLCKKIAADNAHPQISAHSPWEGAYKRSFEQAAGAQEMAYSAYTPQQ